MATPAKRFKIALSFPGEHRGFVAQVAEVLADAVGRDAVLYDRFHEAELARLRLGFYLPSLYHDESELIAVFLGADYQTKEWCGLEWDAIFDLVKKREHSAVMPFRFDDTEIPGLFSTDGYVDIRGRSPQEIAQLVLDRYTINRGQRPGRPTKPGKSAPSRLRHAAAHLLGRDDELARLHQAWNDPRTHVVTLVAWGGVGKTSLVAHWQAEMAARGFDEARYFDWSFYSQGVRDKSAPSSDAFVSAALRFFGDTALAESPALAWDKGARLAELVAEERTLLVLDGLEPLQHPPGPQGGRLQDPAVTALLKGLAGTNPGLCVVTTRERVVDLQAYRATTSPEWRLGRLSTVAGVALLERLGVRGATPELEQLVEDVAGHALTLNLLGGYLARAHGGDVRRRDQVALDEANPAIQGGHAFKAMDAYASWLAQGGEDGTRQLAVLRLLGLFDRPADGELLRVLRAEPPIPNLTEPIVSLRETDWNLTVATLADCRLIAPPEPGSGTLDAHPLIREYFAAQLRDLRPEAWRLAHGRLFDHLRETTEDRPDTLEALQPLYQAVRHGCEAGRHGEALGKVYFERIVRPGEFFSPNRTGAYGADLGAVASFFESPWSQLVPTLSEADQGWLLNEAAFSLRALGRLAEAVEPMQAGLRPCEEGENWGNASRAARNLSELKRTLGDLAGAIEAGEQSVAFADRVADTWQRIENLATLAEAKHQAGRRDDALALFQKAEAIRAESRRLNPLLFSIAGFHYCNLLLVDAERAMWRVESLGLGAAEPSRPEASDPGDLVGACREIERRASQTLPISRWPLSIALDHLSLGRAWLYRAVLERPASIEVATQNARSEIERAVGGLRRAGDLAYSPLGLLTRAHLRAITGDSEGARADLDEAWQIAERGPMPLFLADIHLHRARIFRDREALAEARRLIEKHGYGRRLPELEDAEAVAGDW